MPELKIENIIFSANFAEKIDTQYLSKKFDNSKYNIDKFSGLILELDNPKCALFILPNGQLFCTGLKNMDDIEIVVNMIINDIDQYNLRIFDDIHIEILDITASFGLSKNLNLNDIKEKLEFENIEFNKDDFPGLIFDIINPKINVIIFKSGKIVFTGAKEIEDIKKALGMLKDNLLNIGIL